jgi:uncharacterized protein (TIGR02145 family)
MKKRILVVLFALALSANLRAQVTIGALTAPKAGALLDLNSTTPGGLVLSNVSIVELSKIPHSAPGLFPGIDGTNDDTNLAFTGAMVYHTGVNNIPTGIYVWNGKNWTPVTENCLSAEDLTLTLTASSIAPSVGTNVTFTVSSNASERCAGSETYTWSVPGANASDYDILSISGDGASIQFTAAGAYTVRVEAHNSYSTGTVSAEITVIVGGIIPQIMLNNNYGIVGAACLDVKKSKQPSTQTNEAFDARIDAFAGGSYEKTYKFIHSDAYSDLSLSCDDPANIVEAVTLYPPASASADGTAVDGYYEEEFKIRFKPNIQNLAPANGDSLTVKLVASYKDSNTADKLTYLEIRVEDGTCVCPAKVSATEWLNFMCHNLGATYDIISSSQIATRAHHGDWYRFGSAVASLTNVAANDGYNNSAEWSTKPVFSLSSDWPAIGADGVGNPCPAGWRLPTRTEYERVKNNNTWTTGSGWRTFNAVRQVNDYLYLPAAGCRDPNNGNLSSRGGIGYYWSSSVGSNSDHGRNLYFNSNSQLVDNVYRRGGCSVRCVAD